MSFEKNKYISDDEDETPPVKKKKIEEKYNRCDKIKDNSFHQRFRTEAENHYHKNAQHRSLEVHSSKKQIRRSSDEENISPLNKELQTKSDYNKVPDVALNKPEKTTNRPKAMDRPFEPYEKPLARGTKIPKKKDVAAQNNPVDCVEEQMKRLFGDDLISDEQQPTIATENRAEILFCGSPLKESDTVKTAPPMRKRKRRRGRPSYNVINNLKKKEEKVIWSMSPVRDDASPLQNGHRSRREDFERNRDKRSARSSNRESPPVTRSNSRSRSLPPEEKNSKSIDKRPDVSSNNSPSKRRRSTSRCSNRESPPVLRSSSRSRSLPPEEKNLNYRKDQRSNTSSNNLPPRRRSRSRSSNRESPPVTRSTSKSRCLQPEEENLRAAKSESSRSSRPGEFRQKRERSNSRRRNDNKKSNISDVSDDDDMGRNRSRSRSVSLSRFMNAANSEVLSRLRNRSKSREPERYSPSLYSKPEKNRSHSRKSSGKSKHGKDHRSSDKNHERYSSSKRKSSEEKEKNAENDKAKRHKSHSSHQDKRNLDRRSESEKKAKERVDQGARPRTVKDNHWKHSGNSSKAREYRRESRSQSIEKQKIHESNQRKEKERQQEEKLKAEKEEKKKQEHEKKRMEEKEKKRQEEEELKREKEQEREKRKQKREHKRQKEEELKREKEKEEKEKRKEEQRREKEDRERKEIKKDEFEIMKEKQKQLEEQMRMIEKEIFRRSEEKKRKEETKKEKNKNQERKETSKVTSEKDKLEKKIKTKEDKRKEKPVNDSKLEDENIQKDAAKNPLIATEKESASTADTGHQHKKFRYRYRTSSCEDNEGQVFSSDKEKDGYEANVLENFLENVDQNCNINYNGDKIYGNYLPGKIINRSHSAEDYVEASFFNFEYKNGRRYSDGYQPDEKELKGFNIENYTLITPLVENDKPLELTAKPVDLRLVKENEEWKVKMKTVKGDLGSNGESVIPPSMMFEDISEDELDGEDIYGQDDDEKTVILSEGEEERIRVTIKELELEETEEAAAPEVFETKSKVKIVHSEKVKRKMKGKINRKRLIPSLIKQKKRYFLWRKEMLKNKKRKQKRGEKIGRKKEAAPSTVATTPQTPPPASDDSKTVEPTLPDSENLTVIGALIELLHERYLQIKKFEEKLAASENETVKKINENEVKKAKQCYQSFILEHCNTVIENFEKLSSEHGSTAVYVAISKKKNVSAEDVSKLITHCVQTESHTPDENPATEDEEHEEDEENEELLVDSTPNQAALDKGEIEKEPTVSPVKNSGKVTPDLYAGFKGDKNVDLNDVFEAVRSHEANLAHNIPERPRETNLTPPQSNAGRAHISSQQLPDVISSTSPLQFQNQNPSVPLASVNQNPNYSSQNTSYVFSPNIFANPSHPNPSTSRFNQQNVFQFPNTQTSQPHISVPPQFSHPQYTSANSRADIPINPPVSIPNQNYHCGPPINQCPIYSAYNVPSASAARPENFTNTPHQPSAAFEFYRRCGFTAPPQIYQHRQDQSKQQRIPYAKSAARGNKAESGRRQRKTSNVQIIPPAPVVIPIPIVQNIPNLNSTFERVSEPNSIPATSAENVQKIFPQTIQTEINSSVPEKNPVNNEQIIPNVNFPSEKTSKRSSNSATPADTTKISQPNISSEQERSQPNISEEQESEQTISSEPETTSSAPVPDEQVMPILTSFETSHKENSTATEDEAAVSSEREISPTTTASHPVVRTEEEEEEENLADREIEKGEFLFKPTIIKKEVDNESTSGQNRQRRIHIKREKFQAQKNVQTTIIVDLGDSDDDDDIVEIAVSVNKKKAIRKEKETLIKKEREDEGESNESEIVNRETDANEEEAPEDQREKDKQNEENTEDLNEKESEEQDENDGDDEHVEDDPKLFPLVPIEESCTRRRQLECAKDGCESVARFICSNCRFAVYCSVGCQKFDWKASHAESCMSFD